MDSVDQELLHHAAALRSLARRLVGDAADDLVQDVAVQVLQRPPREPGPMLAWLRSIVKHLASSHHRAERRRLAHETQGKTPEAGAWPEQLAAHREILHRLHMALMNLQEPYRAVLLARFYEGLTPTAIAARSGVPLATVKSSLQRGLAMLRECMDRGGGWRSSLCAALGIESVALVPGGAAAGLAGGIAMGNAVKLAVGGVVLAAAAAWACWPAPTSTPIGVEKEQRAPAVAATAELPEQPRLAVAPAGELRFRLLAVDDDAPLAPDRVEFSFGNDAHSMVATEGNGFRIPRADAYESLRVRVRGEHVAETYFWLLPSDVAPDGETILRVSRVVPVVLRVVGDSARAMAGVAVDLERKEPPARPGRAPMQQASPPVSAISDGTGVAKFSAVSPGIYTVSTRCQGWMVEQPGTLVVAAPTVEATVWLRRDDGWEVRGRVVDATTREGVAGAAILTVGMHVSATTDAAGVFVLPGEIRRADSGAFFHLLVRPAPADRAHGPVAAGPFWWEDREIVIALESGRHFLRFDLGGAGEPVRVDWCKQQPTRLLPEPSNGAIWEALARGENGMYELPWDSDWQAMVWLRVQWGPGLHPNAPRYTLASRLPVERTRDGQVLVWKAPAVQALEVTVRDAQHAPVPGCSVEALFQAGTSIVGTAKAIPDYDPSLSNPLTANLVQALLTVRTDAQGSATLAVPVAAGVALRARADGFLDEVVEVGAKNGIEIVLLRVGALHGEIANVDASNPRVHLVPAQGSRPPSSHGALVRRGAFAFESLPVGTYRVFLVDQPGPQTPYTFHRYFDLGEASVTAGVVAEFHGDALGLRTMGVKVSSRDLVPGDELVWHEPRLGFQVARTPIEQLGAANLSLPPGTYRVLRMRWEPGLSRQVGVFADEEVSVAAPGCATDLTFPRGTLRCRLLDAGQPFCSTWVQVVGSSFEGITRTDLEGWVRFPVLPGTRFEVARVAQQGASWKLDWPRWRLGAGDEGRSIEVAER